jgi:thymidylate synthase
MKQYKKLLATILNDGNYKKPAREGMPPTFSHTGLSMVHDMSDGFPLLTTKHTPIRSIIHELLWFMSGDTNIKYLVDNNVKIWNDDAYKYYCRFASDNGGIEQNCILRITDDVSEGGPWYTMLQKDEFIDIIKNAPSVNDLPVYKVSPDLLDRHGNVAEYRLGDLGKVYGHQWRNQNGVDQLLNVINGIKANPESRYHILDAWNPSDFDQMALPPCHCFYQFVAQPMDIEELIESLQKSYKVHHTESDLDLASIVDYDHAVQMCQSYSLPVYKLDLCMTQRSVDAFLGLPFNVPSMGALLMFICKLTNMVPGKLCWTGGDVHIYTNHVDQVMQLLSREPKSLPTLTITKDIECLADVLSLNPKTDIELSGYDPHPAIKADLSVGV